MKSRLAKLLPATIVLCAATAASAEDITIRMAAPDWGPTRFMQEHADASYKAPSGNSVKLEIDFIPWPNFFDRVNASLNSGEQKYQMIVSDSQWLGTFIEAGHFLKLNDYIEADPALQAIMADLHPALVSGYSTYPHVTSDKIAELGGYSPEVGYYGFPQFPDNYFTYYRTDLFCDEGESAAFEARYGKALPCAPSTWETVTWADWRNFGEFFTRSAGETLAGKTLESDVYGIAYQAGKPLDFSTMQINAFLWQHGGGIWDESQEPHAPVLGVVNSDENVAGLEEYLSLLAYAPPIATTGQMGIFEIQDLYMQGKIACANVLSDLYAMGVTECDNMLMLLGVSNQMTLKEREIVTPMVIKGFNDLALEAGTTVNGGQTVLNPWFIVGGVASSVVSNNEFVM